MRKHLCRGGGVTITIYHHISTFITIYLPLSPYIYLYHHISTFITIYLPSSPYIYLHHHISTFITIYLPSSPYIYLDHHISTFITISTISSSVGFCPRIRNTWPISRDGILSSPWKKVKISIKKIDYSPQTPIF